MSTTPEEQDEAQVRPFSEFLIQQANGRTHDELSDVLHDLVAAVKATGKGGKLALTLDVQTGTSMNVLYGTPPSAVQRA